MAVSITFNVLLKSFILFFRPAELPKDIKTVSPDLPCLIVVLIIVSWTTCGAFAIFLTYLYYLFKVCQISDQILYWAGIEFYIDIVHLKIFTAAIIFIIGVSAVFFVLTFII